MNLIEKLLVLKSTSVLYFGIIMRIYYSKEKYFKHKSDDFFFISRKDFPNCCRIFQAQSERTNEMRIKWFEEMQKFLLLLLFVQVLSSFLALLNTVASILTSFL